MAGLRAKLDAIGAGAKPQPKAHPHGVKYYENRFPLERDIYALSPAALRRMGWQGRIFVPERALFLDTETTGLSGGAGTVAFLVGLGFIRGEYFVVEQYLMQDYSDEADMLGMIARRMQEFNVCVTYNGKSFDMPLLNTRFTMNRMAGEYTELEQLDLLHAARRVWKLRLGHCRLSDLEERILGRPRQDDIPGSEVPQRYFDFLKSGDSSLLEDVVLHNRQDIVSLMTILCRLCDVYARPQEQSSPQDLFSLGKALERQGELGTARELYRLSAVHLTTTGIRELSESSVAGMANWRHYLLLRRSRDWDAAWELLQQMIRRKQMKELPYIELAKIAEHRYADLPRALQYTELAMKIAPAESMEALNKRKKRITDKMYR